MVTSLASSRPTTQPTTARSTPGDTAGCLSRRHWLVAALAAGAPVLFYGSLRSVAAEQPAPGSGRGTVVTAVLVVVAAAAGWVLHSLVR